jgi:glutathione synthase/RimK-type ligase-like ATP-grasp enzyme
MASAAKSVATIGSTELVAFPDLHIEKVPAKIDTGADSSAVWASDIAMDGHTLCYVLFGPGSAFYSGGIIRTETYRVIKVRNSFGHYEFRYKVKLRIKVGEKRLLSWFTLADRSQNTFPILLGKSFLKTRFVVDVSRKHVLQPHGAKANILVFSRNPDANKEFFDEVAKHQTVPASYQSLSYGSLLFHLAPRNIQVTTLPSEQDIAQSDLVYLKTHQDNAEQAKAVAEYLHYKAVRYIGHEIGQDSAGGKLSEYMRLAAYDLPIPTSIAATPNVLKDRYEELVHELGQPFVLKDSSSDRGKDNFLIDSAAAFTKVLADKSEQYIYIAQRYIANDGYIRLLVTGHEVALAIGRTPSVSEDPLKAHLNQPRGGANAALLALDEIPPHVQDIGTRAAAVMQREIAGIDLIQDRETKEWYVLEVNNAPQIRSGTFIDEKLKAVAAYFDHELSQ